jgi:hypothetical protein
MTAVECEIGLTKFCSQLSFLYDLPLLLPSATISPECLTIASERLPISSQRDRKRDEARDEE